MIRDFNWIKKKYIIDELTGCWNWSGFKNTKGYGRVQIASISTAGGKRKRITRMAHRVSYEIFKDKIPTDIFVCHKCDNPSCINPDHLFLGTNQDNVDDRQRKGRNKTFPGEKQYSATLTNNQAAEIRDKYKTGKYSYSSLANEYGLKNKCAIQRVIKNRSFLK